MPNKIKVVTAYVPLNLEKRPSEEFHELGQRLIGAASINPHTRVRYFADFPFEDCWLAKEAPPLKCANPRAADRFVNEEEQWNSNIVQHSPVQWLSMAHAEDPAADVLVWFGYSLLKQGDFTGKRITEGHVGDFLEKLSTWNPSTIPFPGITPPSPVNDHGDNWRFCGSTLIVPARFLDALSKTYIFECRRFVRRVGAVPLDLAIWPSVESNGGLPMRWYKAEYDYTQLTEFPCS